MIGLHARIEWIKSLLATHAFHVILLHTFVEPTGRNLGQIFLQPVQILWYTIHQALAIILPTFVVMTKFYFNFDNY